MTLHPEKCLISSGSVFLAVHSGINNSAALLLTEVSSIHCVKPTFVGLKKSVTPGCMTGFSSQSVTHSHLSGYSEPRLLSTHACVRAISLQRSALLSWPPLTCSLYFMPITLLGESQETWRPSRASRGPSCVFICWANFQPRYWTPSNYTVQATGTCGLDNDLQIALWTVSSAGPMHT